MCLLGLQAFWVTPFVFLEAMDVGAMEADILPRTKI